MNKLNDLVTAGTNDPAEVAAQLHEAFEDFPSPDTTVAQWAEHFAKRPELRPHREGPKRRGRPPKSVTTLPDHSDGVNEKNSDADLPREPNGRKRENNQVERPYYAVIRSFLERQGYWAKEVPDNGKGGGRSFTSIPDVIAVRYRKGVVEDEIDLHAVEVKPDIPNRAGLSEALRYERFADYCYIAFPAFPDKAGIIADVKEECQQMGLGVILFPPEAGRGRRIDIEPGPQRRKPDPLAKHIYLADRVQIWKCYQCGTYHLVEDLHGQLVETKRDSVLQEKATNPLDPADARSTVLNKRYKCKKCQGLA